jgi:PPOX class probable F420-dependent enzyme
MTFAELGRETYVNLASFRRDGREVRTPVWIAPDGERLVVYTNAGSGKVKRIRNGGRVRLAPCDMRGGLRGDWLEAHARVIDDPAERDRALEAVVRKYALQMRAARLLARLSGRWAARAAVEIRPAPSQEADS